MFQRITPRWRYEVVPQVHRCFQLLLEFTRSWNVFEQYCPRCDLNVLIHWLSFFEPHRPPFIDSSFSHHSFSPSWYEYCLFFLSRVHCIAPRWLNFSRSVEKSWCHFCRGFCKFNLMFFLFDNLFLFWNQISYFKGHVYSSLIVEMKSKRCQFWKRSFENQAF
jgi:hypothetical protein